MSSQLKARSVLHFLFTKLCSCQSNNVCLQVDGQESDSYSVHEDEYLSWSLTHIGVMKKNVLIPVKKCFSSKIDKITSKSVGK